jgi:hypothetical protein
MITIASKLMKIARSLVGSAGLNGMKNREARKFVNTLLQKHTRGLFKDDYWRPITKTFKLLAAHEIDYEIKNTEYTKDANGNPDSKRWSIEIGFTNNNGRDTTLYGTIVASGAGTVSDPLSRYDVAAYAN